MRTIALSGALLLACCGLPAIAIRDARACQACVEDKIAATYDWEVVSAAKRQGHTVIFTAIAGPVRSGDAQLERRLRQGVAAVPGVDPGSVRVSLSPPALSFAADLRQRGVKALIAEANRRLQLCNVALSVVRVGAPAGAPAATSTRGSSPESRSSRGSGLPASSSR